MDLTSPCAAATEEKVPKCCFFLSAAVTECEVSRSAVGWELDVGKEGGNEIEESHASTVMHPFLHRASPEHALRSRLWDNPH